jgi:N-acetylglucosaminyldiphosphoundecaprenol N-acetyl-beta-D-mannosaminyltransferase
MTDIEIGSKSSPAGRVWPPFYAHRPYPQKHAPAAELHFWQQHPVVAEHRTTFLDAPMHTLTMLETLNLARQAMQTRQPLHHTVINVAKLVTMHSNAELARDVSEADLINIDGAGVVWGARLFGISVPERVAGVDIMEGLFRMCAENGFRPYLLGAESAVLDAVQQRLRRDYPTLDIAGARDGYFSAMQEEDVILDINASGADCLFVAMPSPRKERFLYKYRLVLAPYFIMGVGGSFDVYGGKVRRAPLWMQKAGMEWLYRVIQEPRRLWRRYWNTNWEYGRLLWSSYWSRNRGTRS